MARGLYTSRDIHAFTVCFKTHCSSQEQSSRSFFDRLCYMITGSRIGPVGTRTTVTMYHWMQSNGTLGICCSTLHGAYTGNVRHEYRFSPYLQQPS